MVTIDQAEKTTAQNKLTELLPKGTEVYTLVRSVSKSGMSRRISFFVVNDGKLEDIDWLLIRAGIGKRRGHDNGLYVTGTGMDMCFGMVYDIGHTIHNDGYALTKRDI